MSFEGQSETEMRIKRFLDGCAYILLRDNPEGTLTHYKDIMIGSKEISASSCPAYIADMIDGGGATLNGGDADEQLQFSALIEKLDEKAKAVMNRQERKSRCKRDSRFDRIAAIHRAYPGCSISMPLAVDTCGQFFHENVHYLIDERCEQYRVHKTRYGDQYDMDRITVVRCKNGKLVFFDQAIRQIDSSMITIV